MKKKLLVAVLTTVSVAGLNAAYAQNPVRHMPGKRVYATRAPKMMSLQAPEMSMQEQMGKPEGYRLRWVQLDNDMDGEQATGVLVQLISKPSMISKPVVVRSYKLQPDSESRGRMRNVSDLPQITHVRVIGLSGPGKGQTAQYKIPGKLARRRSIKIDIDLKGGKLMLSKD